MRLKKRLLCFLFICISICNLFFITTAYAEVHEKYYLGGYPAGFTLYTRGAYVLGLCDVATDDCVVSPCKDAGIKNSDIILSIDGDETNNAQDIEKFVTDGRIKVLKIKRGNEYHFINVKPAKDINGKYRLGVFVRDSVNGIGTITYLTDTRFASLGHPITTENGYPLEITGGSLCMCSITGSVRGERGKAGELRGAFLKRSRLGKIESNLIEGVYGELEKNAVDVFDKKEVQLGNAKAGEATIRTTVEGNEPKTYKISIIKVDEKNDNKNFVIRITDRKLLEETGGIVQGMSGSPIIQDGKLVGAVTHVFINDPTRGFGISIDKMINK